MVALSAVMLIDHPWAPWPKEFSPVVRLAKRSNVFVSPGVPLAPVGQPSKPRSARGSDVSCTVQLPSEGTRLVPSKLTRFFTAAPAPLNPSSNFRVTEELRSPDGMV